MLQEDLMHLPLEEMENLPMMAMVMEHTLPELSQL
jgi:hypothetical protein